MPLLSHFHETRVSRGALLIALCSAFCSKPALAQDADAPKTDTVVVTATRTPTDVDRIPARVTVITRADMEDKNFSTTVEALAATPGITVVQSGGAGTITSVFSRGTNSKHTLALFDGIRLNDASAPNGQYNFGQDTVGSLERIEVVRGAASSIYGSDAIGGVINFIPRVGSEGAFSPFFDIAAGSLDTYRASVGATGTAGPLSYAGTAEHFETGGFNNVPDRFPNNLDENDGSTFNALTGVADFKVSDSATVRGLLRWRESDADFDNSALDSRARSAEDQYLVWRLGPRFSLLDNHLDVELNGGQVKNKRSDISGASATTTEGTRSFANWRNVYSIDPVGAWSNVQISGGVEWQNEDIDVPPTYSNALARSEDALGFYALLRGQVMHRVDLSASARRDNTDSFGDADTWNVGASVDLPEIAGRIYASAGTSFKAPTLSERFSESAYTLASPDLKPEEGESWEVGFDIEPAESVRLGATWFDTEIDNLIESRPDTSGKYKNFNVGVATIEGYETYLELNPIRQISARITYTYTDARNGATDARLLRRPPHQWGASVKFTPISKLVVSLDYMRRGHREDVLYGNTNPYGQGGGYLGNGRVEAYEIYNAAVRYTLTDALSIYGSVHNFTDEEFEDPNSYRGQPITWSVGLRGSF